MGTGLREPLHADWGQDEDEWVGVDNHASARQAWRSPEARKSRKWVGFAATVLRTTNVCVLTLSVFGFGAGFFSLLSAEDDVRGAVPLERFGAAALLAVSALSIFVSTAGLTAMLTASNVVLFVYFVMNILANGTLIMVATAAAANSPWVESQYDDWCLQKPADFVPCGSGREEELLQIQDHLSTVYVASAASAAITTINMVACFALMQVTHKPTLLGATSGRNFEDEGEALGEAGHRGGLDLEALRARMDAQGHIVLGDEEELDVEALVLAYSPRGGPIMDRQDEYLRERLYAVGSDSD